MIRSPLSLSLALVPIMAAAPCSAADDAVVSYTVQDAARIESPLVDGPTDPANGRAIVEDPVRGACRSCHAVEALDGDETPDIPTAIAGPELGAAARARTDAELRLFIVNPAIVRPGTVMPAYYHIDLSLAEIDPNIVQPRLTAQEVEDLVAYIRSLAD